MDTQILETVSIVSTPGVLEGKPRIAGHRISVELVGVWHDENKLSVEEISQRLPTLNEAEIYAALSYYHAHREEILQRRDEEEEELADSPGVTHIDAEAFLSGNFSLILTPKEIAQEFGVTVDAVYQAVRRGAIPHRRSGGTILIARWEAEKRWKVKSRRGRPKRGKSE